MVETVYADSKPEASAAHVNVKAVSVSIRQAKAKAGHGVAATGRFGLVINGFRGDVNDFALDLVYHPGRTAVMPIGTAIPGPFVGAAGALAIVEMVAFFGFAKILAEMVVFVGWSWAMVKMVILFGGRPVIVVTRLVYFAVTQGSLLVWLDPLFFWDKLFLAALGNATGPGPNRRGSGPIWR